MLLTIKPPEKVALLFVGFVLYRSFCMLKQWLALVISAVAGVSFVGAQIQSIEQYSNSNPAMAYYASDVAQQPMVLGTYDNRMAFKYNELSVVLDDDAERKGGLSPRLLQSGNNLYALWWVKLDNTQKKLHFRASRDLGKTWEKLQTINTGKNFQVLGHFDMISPTPEQIAIIYYDERTGYGVYMNRSVDGGRTWLERDILLSTLGDKADIKDTEATLAKLITEEEKDSSVEKKAETEETVELLKPSITALEPHLYSVGKNQLVALWKEFVPRKNFDVLQKRLPDRLKNDRRYTHQAVIRLAYSTDFGENWRIANVYESANEVDILPISLSFMQHKNEWWVNAHLEQGIALFSSNNQGETWLAHPVKANDKGIQSFDGARFALAGDSIWAVYTNYYVEGNRASYMARFDMSSGQWTQAIPLFLVSGESHAISQSDSAYVVAVDDKNIVIAWNEFGFVVPSVMLSYYTLTDDGWQLRDQKTLDWEKGVKAQYILDLQKVADNTVRVSIKNSVRYGAQVFSQLDYVVNVSADKGLLGNGLKSLPVQVDLDQRKESLLEALNAYWKAKLEEDDGVAYSLLDPYYRQQNSLRNFITSQAYFDYISYDVKDVGIDALGYRAVATVELAYTVQQTADPATGRKAETVSSKQVTSQNWVYIDGEWFLEVRLGIGNNSFIQ